MNTIWARNVPHAYCEAILKLRMWGEEEESRNGKVITSPDPVLLQINRPTQRVLFDEVRDANPFFHVMEFVWMMAGQRDVQWIERFNKRFRTYAEPLSGLVHGAYGYRWVHQFGRNQIQTVGDMLRSDRTTRRAVIGMWDPRVDLEPHNDLPCNTTIMFRFVESSGLDMTVINRSNDLFWGMLGANAVHMTYLHELVAHISGLPIGYYKVFTNNLHAYIDVPNFQRMWATLHEDDQYKHGGLEPYPLLRENENYNMLMMDCLKLISYGLQTSFETDWMLHVAIPMYNAYMDRLNGGDGRKFVERIMATDWRLACERYINRRELRK